MTFSSSVHCKNFCPDDVGNERQPLATIGNQLKLRLAFGAHHAPKDAPSNLVRQVESAAHALAISIAAGHHKLDYIAAAIGKSRAYISRLQRGERPIPIKLIKPLCAATGSNLLAQFLALQEAIQRIEAESGRQNISRLARLLEAA